ncbi:MAG: AraC family transcriptional regulator, partial [Burkholderiales bacterium]|nr:AraC family transcriptional regulator [Burkholderiales bacterium]
IIDYISANLHRPLELDKLADRIHVSQRQLLRIMRSFLDESLSAYVARQRVERAVMYMQAEEMGLAELSSMVGYESPQSFSKAFRKQLRTSPKAYVNELRARLENYVKTAAIRAVTFRRKFAKKMIWSWFMYEFLENTGKASLTKRCGTNWFVFWKAIENYPKKPALSE